MIFKEWVTSAQTNPQLGILPAHAYVYDVEITVETAFDSDGSDNVEVGYSTDPNAYATNTDVSTTGRKTVTLGSGVGYDATARDVDITYTAGGSAAAAGKAVVIIFYEIMPVTP